ncbi:MAG: 50S ribosomal protein L24 [Thermodesulfobacteriota bacterium]
MAGSRKLKKDDRVEVITGKDKGRVGKILRIAAEDRIIVEKVNMIKRHTKPNMANQQGGIVEKEAALHISNVKLICPKCSKTVKVGKKILEDGTKIRTCKGCGESVDGKA